MNSDMNSRLIDEQTAITVHGNRDGELTRRLRNWPNKRKGGGVRGHKGRTEKLESLGASSDLCWTNWGGGRAWVVFSLSWSSPFSLFPLYFPCLVIISQIFCHWDSSSGVSMGKTQAFLFFPLCSVVCSVFKIMHPPRAWCSIFITRWDSHDHGCDFMFPCNSKVTLRNSFN